MFEKVWLCDSEDGSELDAAASWFLATDLVENGEPADKVAEAVLDALDDGEQDDLRDQARRDNAAGGLDPRGSTARLMAALEVADPRGGTWLSAFDAKAVCETLRERDDARQLVIELRTALNALYEWGCTYTSPRDANSPHELLITARVAILKAQP